jgi:hypothetical protein
VTTMHTHVYHIIGTQLYTCSISPRRQNLGQVEIDDLEAKWMQQQYERDICEEEEGAENATGYDDDDYDDDDEKTANGPTGGGGGPSAIHMDLFYNINDHE